MVLVTESEQRGCHTVAIDANLEIFIDVEGKTANS